MQRVFINLLDTYSSKNIGKVSGGGPEPDPSPRPQQGPVSSGVNGATREGDLMSWTPGTDPVSKTSSPTWKLRCLEIAGPALVPILLSVGKWKLRGRKGLAKII
jgi:hypothetical protein